MPIQLVHTKLDVATSSGEALAARPTRNYLLLENDSDTVIYIKFDAPAVLNEGIRLNASGGAYELYGDIIEAGAVNAIHGGAGTKRLLVSESG